MTIQTVLFDLDGTLLDTAPDLAFALNRLREEEGLAALPLAQIRPVVSHGSPGLLRVGFDLGAADAGYAELRERLLGLYQDRLACDTRLFPGMEQLLATLERNGLSWGVVTNKPGWLTEPLLDHLALTNRACCVVSGDSTANRKPHPEPMLYACSLAGCDAGQCLYIGDAERDIIAGRSAGMKTLVAMFGYLSEDDRPDDWGADGLVETPQEIFEWVEQNNKLTVPAKSVCEQ